MIEAVPSLTTQGVPGTVTVSRGVMSSSQALVLFSLHGRSCLGSLLHALCHRR
jgi:hypothetical protein